jgi:hypothetical protein
LSKTRNKGHAVRREAIIDAHRAEIEAIIAGFTDLTPERFLFVDQRTAGSLKLTKIGYEFLKDKHTHWSQKLPEYVTVGNYVYLIGVSTYPYYISDGVLVTFDPNLGVSFKLAGGDFEKLMTLLGH